MSGPWRMVIPDHEFGELLAMLEATELPVGFHFALEGLTVTTADEDAAVLLHLALGRSSGKVLPNPCHAL